MSAQLTVHSEGIFHGLPTYPASGSRPLTALVAGATGLSGFHMVKVLAAAPQRWSRIYCLSSRAPPDNFFGDLGEAAAGRVEHLQVDFLDEPERVAERLREKIESVDHVFYFSYKQPPPTGDALDLWANAEELDRINLTLFTNFIAALQTANLNPKRFLLQTGSKHYAFYLGPASIPAFESDPRVHIDGNFYYKQEDALAAYCQSVNITWNVVRPTYIIGAVRDGALNHLIGFGIYAAVQRRLGKAISFPGDYRAWDREQHQSSGLLNAYFQEWVSLNENLSGEALNIHDGDSFTWGRLWPYLARWYGVEWNPPETDESKYRSITLQIPTTPRGYGPQTTFKSTFSLLEWSLQSEVETTWKEISKEYQLVLDPLDPNYRARIFSFSDSAVIGDGPMTMSLRKARKHGFFGTVDSYQSIFVTFQELARLKVIPPPVVGEYVE